ncbi:lysine-rich nucleolar protein 1 isoform X2 [Rissa tridactyla]|uniref:lysine-rich nucleolar protein 1 isoform X2 n=1 Tax=Rissa tridactyla TaxID=75485 RepID=UPI0023BA4F44|nr:lysine-rich nucleolar protein 1 isoform X2 [Rissa tridactyla]
MIIKKKRKEVHVEPVQKKKNVKSGRSHIIIKNGEDVQTVIKTEDDDQLETKTKVRKKENLKEDDCLHQLELKKKKKKNKKKKVDSELLEEAHSESFVNVGGHPDSKPQEESEEEIKILKKKKKKVQCHSSLSLENNETSDAELSNHHTDGIKENEFAFKKSRKNTALNLELDDEVPKKKKEVTKKKKKKDDFSLEDIQDSEHKQSEKVRKKPHKYISEEKAFTGENHGTDIIQNDGENYVRRKKRKKKKDKSISFLSPADTRDNIYGVPDSPIALRDFRKRQRKNFHETAFTNREEKDATENSGSIRETKRKKKRSKDVSSLTCEDDQGYSHRVPDKHLPAQQEVESEEKELSGKKCRKTIKGNNELIEKKKKKKIQKEEEETTYSKVSLSNDSVSKSQKITLLESNKKNKESEMKRAECVAGDVVDRVLCMSNHTLCDKKRKKRKKEVPQDSAEEQGSKANPKKKKIKSEDMGNKALEHMDDVTIVQEKKGNCDEINIDKGTKFGQWSTAAFQSSEEETKFFRLMGGFKKGSMPTQNLSATTNKPNMALNREGEEKLQQALKMEFDKAMDLKQHRGIGLGFQPAANKKVYIDKYTTRSIKFED